MFKLEEFKQLVRDFSDVADFLVIYVAEAHSAGQSQLLLQPTPPPVGVNPPGYLHV